MGETEYITRPEHDEMIRRFDGEESRQNHRLEVLEGRVDKLIDTITSVNVMQEKINMISEDIKKLSSEVEDLRQEPADKWKKATWIVITVVITAVATLVVSRLL